MARTRTATHKTAPRSAGSNGSAAATNKSPVRLSPTMQANSPNLRDVMAIVVGALGAAHRINELLQPAGRSKITVTVLRVAVEDVRDRSQTSYSLTSKIVTAGTITDCFEHATEAGAWVDSGAIRNLASQMVEQWDQWDEDPKQAVEQTLKTVLHDLCGFEYITVRLERAEIDLDTAERQLLLCELKGTLALIHEQYARAQDHAELSARQLNRLRATLEGKSQQGTTWENIDAERRELESEQPLIAQDIELLRLSVDEIHEICRRCNVPVESTERTSSNG